jgi:hypothetical protein
MTDKPEFTPIVIGFDNIDDLFAFMASNRQAAIAAMTPEQQAITYGCFWMRTDSSPMFGYVMTLAEIEAAERNAGSEDDELEATIRNMEANHDDGYRFGWVYSIVTPDGELGTTHCSTMMPISEIEFLAARDAGWKLS